MSKIYLNIAVLSQNLIVLFQNVTKMTIKQPNPASLPRLRMAEVQTVGLTEGKQ
jgi:hypothetical protein